MRTKVIKVSEEEYLLVRMAQELLDKRRSDGVKDRDYDGTMGATIKIAVEELMSELKG